MHKIRIIPILLLRDWGLEKSIRFDNPVYIGSPINAARVFNGRNVDELITPGALLSDAVEGGGVGSWRAVMEAELCPWSLFLLHMTAFSALTEAPS